MPKRSNGWLWKAYGTSPPNGWIRTSGGERFSVYVPMKGNNGKVANVLTAWIYDRLEDGRLSTVPRLSNCYLDKKSIAYIKNMEKYHA